MDETIDVLIEIPRGSRNKYEVDHATGRIRLDVLVLTEDPTFPGCWINARPVGVMWMEDEAGPDAKVICVEPNEPRWKGVNDIDDLPSEILAEIKHFFDIYKDLEPEKFSVTGDFKDRACAWDEIRASLARYTEAHEDST
jgi:inorganic pyrophosphatase